MNNQTLGPNLEKFIQLVMSRFDSNKPPTGNKRRDERRVKMLRKRATTYCNRAVALYKSSTSNPFGDDEEKIAADISKQIEEGKVKI